MLSPQTLDLYSDSKNGVACRLGKHFHVQLLIYDALVVLEAIHYREWLMFQNTNISFHLVGKCKTIFCSWLPHKTFQLS